MSIDQAIFSIVSARATVFRLNRHSRAPFGEYRAGRHRDGREGPGAKPCVSADSRPVGRSRCAPCASEEGRHDPGLHRGSAHDHG